MSTKIEDKKIDLSYKFKKGEIINYDLKKIITEKTTSNTGEIFYSKKTCQSNIEQKIINIDNRDVATIEIKEKKRIKKIDINKKGEIIKRDGPLFPVFTFPEENISINSSWRKKYRLYLPFLSSPLEYDITYVISEYIYLKEYNCVRIEALPEEINYPLIMENTFTCNQITSFDGEFYFAHEEGLLVKSIQRTNIIARIETFLIDSNLETVMEIMKK